MKMLEISALENGAHRNQTYHGFLPDGWAVIPDEMECENFPFGEVTAEEVNSIMTVTSWTPGNMPEVEEPETPPQYVTYDELAAAIAEGVNSI